MILDKAPLFSKFPAAVMRIGVLIMFVLGASFDVFGTESSQGPMNSGRLWRYVVVDDHPPAGWDRWNYDDSWWAEGPAPFGAGTALVRTRLQPALVTSSILLLRQEFVINDRRATRLRLRIASDGPFSVYLNGVGVFASDRPLPYRIDTSQAIVGFELRLDGFAHELLPGRNVIALEVSRDPGTGNGFIVAPSFEIGLEDTNISDATTSTQPGPVQGSPRNSQISGIEHVILMVCDGWGEQHIEATRQFVGGAPAYQLGGQWASTWMSTYPVGGSYDGAQAWSSFGYPMAGSTDSAAAATALFSGVKTSNGRISVDANNVDRLETVGERARRLGMVVGAVTTVPITHATPGAFTSHNTTRGNAYAIGDEAFFGDPNTTGTPANDVKYGGGFGPTMPPADVLVGDRAASYFAVAQRDRLASESGQPGKHLLVEGATGIDGGAALLAAASDPSCLKLAGLFDRAGLKASAPDWNYTLETPSLAETTNAALTVLDRNTAGFVLMVEGGAVDWGAHANNLDLVIGELQDFNSAVQTVIDWVDESANGSTWDNTLVLVTGDHETGYLTRAPGVFPNELILPGAVTLATLALEKTDVATGKRASWIDDAPANDQIDPGETVYWSWNTTGHSNLLIPLYARGLGVEMIESLALGVDPVRGSYLDNTDVFHIVNALLSAADPIFVDGFESGDSEIWDDSIGR